MIPARLVAACLNIRPHIPHVQLNFQKSLLPCLKHFLPFYLTADSTLKHKRLHLQSTVMSNIEKVKTEESRKKIGTHDGVFHCDEILACYLLKKLPEFEDGLVVRTRDESILESCDIVVDVGGIYDPSRNRYDHHQRSFSESMNSLSSKYHWKTRLSSAGLIYYHFGFEVLKRTLLTDDDDMVRNVYRQVYQYFIEEIDGIDNGIPMFDDEPKYKINTHLSARVSKFNPHWNEQVNNIDERFYNAYDLVGKEFECCVNYFANVWWPARSVVWEALENRYKTHASGEIVEFPSGGLPWREHIYELEETLHISPNIKFVLFSDIKSSWRVQCVPVAPKSFVCRKFLVDSWHGLRDKELSEKAGISDCIFVHSTGFIGGNVSREGAFKMALKSLSN